MRKITAMRENCCPDYSDVLDMHTFIYYTYIIWTELLELTFSYYQHLTFILTIGHQLNGTQISPCYVLFLTIISCFSRNILLFFNISKQFYVVMTIFFSSRASFFSTMTWTNFLISPQHIGPFLCWTKEGEGPEGLYFGFFTSTYLSKQVHLFNYQ